ncbi:MAG: nickel-binding protein [Gaiellaceae bacterium]
MAEFLVELYISRSDLLAAESGAERARLAAEELTREGKPVRYLRSIFVPEDETCLSLYEAATADAVHEVARRAALRFERVAEAITHSKGDNS